MPLSSASKSPPNSGVVSSTTFLRKPKSPIEVSRLAVTAWLLPLPIKILPESSALVALKRPAPVTNMLPPLELLITLPTF